MAKLDAELPTFIRSTGNIAGSTGVTLSEALRRIDIRSLGSLEPHVGRLQVRLGARLPTHECWEKFRQETGSELASRTTHMLVDGSELGGSPDEVGSICSEYALNVTKLRAKRNLTGSTFAFLTVPMHATMTFILLFVLEIITNFNKKLGEASSSVLSKAEGGGRSLTKPSRRRIGAHRGRAGRGTGHIRGPGHDHSVLHYRARHNHIDLRQLPGPKVRRRRQQSQDRALFQPNVHSLRSSTGNCSSPYR